MKSSLACLIVLMSLFVYDVAYADDTIYAQPIKDSWVNGLLKASDDFANTGDHLLRHDSMQSLIIVSPDSNWIILGEPLDLGIDVQHFRFFLMSTSENNIQLISEAASDARFAPTSQFIYLLTSPHPEIYDIRKKKNFKIGNIETWAENKPAWISDWSKDGKNIIIHSKIRWDDDGSTHNSWIVRLK